MPAQSNRTSENLLKAYRHFEVVSSPRTLDWTAYDLLILILSLTVTLETSYLRMYCTGPIFTNIFMIDTHRENTSRLVCDAGWAGDRYLIQLLMCCLWLCEKGK